MDAIPAESLFNPCLNCGACCAYYRASFYWTEADDVTPNGVPIMFTGQLNPYLRVMCGTNQKNPRCIALQGEIGQQVYCSIYQQRASICREYLPSWLDGQANERCDQARTHWGLPPLTPEDWLNTSDFPRVA